MELIIENSYQNHEVFQFAEKELKDYWKKMQEKSDALQVPGSYRLRLELEAGGGSCHETEQSAMAPDGYVIDTG